MRRMVVLIGNYGSGKTEIAVNLAVRAAGEGLSTLVIDLDKVNDYFRMSDRVSLLKSENISLVSPTFAGQGVTPSSMSAAVGSAFDVFLGIIPCAAGVRHLDCQQYSRYKRTYQQTCQRFQSQA